MSVEMVLCCDQCKESLHLGSNGMSGPQFDRNKHGVLGVFLFTHESHPLRFVMDHLAEDYAVFTSGEVKR